jgi:hypothetical protein
MMPRIDWNMGEDETGEGDIMDHRFKANEPLDDKTEAELLEEIRMAGDDEREVLETKLTRIRRAGTSMNDRKAI